MIFQRGDGYVNSNGEPVNQDGTPIGEVQDTATQVAALTEQRNSLQAQVDAGTTEAQERIDALTSERDTLKGTLESVNQELATVKARVSELESTPVPVARAAGLPADARERLIEINGIGEKLADKVLEVLAAAPAEQ